MNHLKSCLNFCCGNPVLLYNMVREGYGIDGSCLGDTLTVCLCSCCAVTRVRAEVAKRGPQPLNMTG